ncbi:MAG: antitoxin [Tenericutes bacterium]|nr:antitoxin [Mycoplasmatota bacterium]
MFTPIDEEELDLIESLEKGEWKEIEENEEYKLQAKKYAEATMKKDKRMNIRISERDLKNLKIKAMEEGLPYQTLVSMILHKYVSGKLLEKV